MALPHPIPPVLAELTAGRMRTIGDPTRIRMLDLLRDGEMPVAQIADALDTSQQNASKHLNVLLQAGILARRKQGTSSLYRVVDPGVYALCEQVCGGLRTHLTDLNALMEDLT